MTTAEVPGFLERIGLPFAYDHFAEGESPKPPFMVYRYPYADHLAADGTAYFKQSILYIELYTDKKDMGLEDRIETALEESGIFYGKSEVWIPSEKLYEIVYEMEVSVCRKKIK